MKQSDCIYIYIYLYFSFHHKYCWNAIRLQPEPTSSTTASGTRRSGHERRCRRQLRRTRNRNRRQRTSDGRGYRHRPGSSRRLRRFHRPFHRHLDAVRWPSLRQRSERSGGTEVNIVAALLLGTFSQSPIKEIKTVLNMNYSLFCLFVFFSFYCWNDFPGYYWNIQSK